MDGSTQNCVDFIASLYPLYSHEHLEDVRCARSMRDGTLIMPSDIAGEVIVWWQGDSTRASIVIASFISSTAVVDYVNYHMVSKPNEDKELMLAQLDEHFELKTGETLLLPDANNELPFLKSVKKLADNVGSGAVLELLKKAFGAF